MTSLQEKKERVKQPAPFFEALFRMQNTPCAATSELQATRLLERMGMPT